MWRKLASVLGLAAASSAAGPADASQPEGLTETMRLYASSVFVKTCIPAMPSLDRIRAAVDALPGEPMSVDDARRGAETLGLAESMEAIEVADQKFEGRLVWSPELSRLEGKPVGAAVLYGSARSNIGPLTVCAVGAPGVPEAELKRVIMDLTGRDLDYEDVVTLPSGEQTKWLNWNTSAGGRNVILLAVTAPSGAVARPDLVRELVAVGLSPG